MGDNIIMAVVATVLAVLGVMLHLKNDKIKKLEGENKSLEEQQRVDELALSKIEEGKRRIEEALENSGSLADLLDAFNGGDGVQDDSKHSDDS